MKGKCKEQELKTKTSPHQDLLDQFIEEAAPLEHKRWALWQKYMFSKCSKNQDGSLTISEKLVKRWKEQIVTKYEYLTHEEQNSDIKEAKKYIPILQRLLNIVRGRYLISQYTRANSELKDVLDDTKANSPYPKDIFTEPTKDEYKKMHKAFKEAGLQPDKFFASAMRKVWDLCIVRIEREFEEIVKSRIIVNGKKK